MTAPESSSSKTGHLCLLFGIFWMGISLLGWLLESGFLNRFTWLFLAGAGFCALGRLMVLLARIESLLKNSQNSQKSS